MCGIAGYYNPISSPERTRQIVLNMTQALRHRGPDDEGIHLSGSMGLGHCRLKVIDLSPAAHQPMANEDQTLWLSYNGEIYNFRELRAGLAAKGHRFRSQSDGEVLLHLYEELGCDFLKPVLGMFAVSLWDEKRQRLLLARDRMGEKPLHYAQFAGGFTFASELKALRAVPELPLERSTPALRTYLGLGYIPAPQTIYQGVHKLLPAHYLVFENGEVYEKAYWEAPAELDPGLTERGAAQLLRQTLQSAVEAQLVSDRPLGVFLSGGLDSSSIVACQSRAGQKGMKSFCIRVQGRGFDESDYAKQVAKIFGTDHHEITLEIDAVKQLLPRLYDVLDEPFADYAFIPNYLLSEFASRDVAVVLGGDGGDELFAGYPTYVAHKMAEAYVKLPQNLRRVLRAGIARLPVSHSYLSLDFCLKRFVDHAGFTNPERHYRWMSCFNSEMQEALLSEPGMPADGAGELFERFYKELPSSRDEDWLERLLALERRFFLPGYMLTKVDRASMAHGLEVRSPFLNQEMVKFASAVPAAMKIRGITTKSLLRRAFCQELPREILNRRKHGLGVPIARWISGPLRTMVASLLGRDRLEAGGLFSPVYVSRLLAEHFSAKADHSRQLWALLMFQLWLDKHGEGAISSHRSKMKSFSS
ncbi:MAG: asparagine synthase (glutamine-hydrolyzing) [Candidatus Omnitrophica bacterium]|nr:asparagine synthase (glutamine-hydrolyzing) [Candidatus Omnitrophota bacterium]